MQRAEQLLADKEFDEAYGLAIRLSATDDSRLAELSERAAQIAKEAEQQKQHWAARLADVEDTVRAAAASRDYEKVVRLLQRFPDNVLDPSFVQLRQASQGQLEELLSLKRRFQQSLTDKDYITAGGLVEQLVSLQPSDQPTQDMATKVGQALIKSAQKRFSAGLYAEALARLDAIPTTAREGSDYEVLRRTIDNSSWLTEQIARSPYATPVLGRLVQRLTKIAPHDERAPKLLQQLALKVKEGSKDPRNLFPQWVGTAAGWTGSPISVLAWPQRIDFRSAPVLKQHPTRFAVCIGLALQGLGLANFSEALSSTSGKGGLSRLLKRRSDNVAWGIDAGSSALRAVKLEKQGDKVVATDAIWLPYDQPLCRTGLELKAAVLQREKLDELAARINVGSSEVPVWAALPSWESLGRFLALPPVAEKRLGKLMEQELAGQFPVPVDQLVASHSITGTGADGSPRAILLAAKRISVQQREKVFTEAGIKLAGLQAEPVAFHNFIRYELSEFFEEPESVTATPDAICCIDAGAAGVTLYVGTRDTFWFRYMDGGGEDLTSKLAGASKATHRDAESLKLNPVDIEDLAAAMEVVEGRMAQTGVRLDQHYQQAAKFLGDMKLRHVFCTGGTALMHGWVRHVLANAGKA